MAAESSSCPDAVVVINSDFQSTTVSTTDLDGHVVDEVLITSSSRETGLSAALTGDVVLPSTAMLGELVLIDRFPSSVITWLDPHSAEPRQLNVSTGFAANPHDYVSLSPTKAYVTRFGENRVPGQSAFDHGSDVLVIDPQASAITASIDMTAALGDDYPEFLPTPDRALELGDFVYVTLTAQAADFSRRAASRVVSLDPATDSIAGVLSLASLESCGSLAGSPSGAALALSCTGSFADTAAEAGYPGSAIVVLDVDGPELSVRAQYPATHFGQGQLGEDLSFIDEKRLLAVSLGRFDESGKMQQADTLLELELDSGDFEILHRSRREPFTLGGVACSPACGKCFAADADPEQPALLVFDTSTDDGLDLIRSVNVDSCSGLPPRQIGFWRGAQ